MTLFLLQESDTEEKSTSTEKQQTLQSDGASYYLSVRPQGDVAFITPGVWATTHRGFFFGKQSYA